MKNYITKIHYKEEDDFIAKSIEFLLSGLSTGYNLGVNLRNFSYKIGLNKKVSLPAYVISVGNLTTGGTGKTPITIEIAQYIKDKLNKNTAILSRGYGGQLSSKGINVVTDGSNIFLTPYMSGDEPYLMAQSSNNIPIITGQDRYASGQHAINVFNSEVIVLDDGFQHIRLKRNLDILVVDCNKQFGNNKLLPAGPLRENISEIKRANKIIVVNKKPFNAKSNQKCLKLAEYFKNKYSKETFCCNFIADKFYDILSNEQKNIENQNVYAFAAIGQPEFFFNSLKNYKCNLVKTREYSDHHMYTKDDIENIINEAQKNNVNSILTTEKDAVKITALLNKDKINIPFIALKLKLDLDIEKVININD